MPRESVRRLLLALAVSVLVHAALLVTARRALPLRLTATMTRIQAVINDGNRIAASEVSPTVPTVVAAPLPPRMSARPETTARRLRELPARTSVPAVAGPAQAPSSVVAPTAGGDVPAAARDGVSPDDLRQYRVGLAIAARRFKRYPPAAREHGWEGAAEVAVSVSAGHRAPELLLIRSSGRAALDEQALSTIEQAAAATAVPESLQGKDFRVLLTIEFLLDPAH